MAALALRPLAPQDRDAALAVINEAARWYEEFLAPEELHGPEMSPADFEAEGRRMTWYGAFAGGRLVGVMGLEHVKDVALVRHAYVLPAWQRQGVGAALLRHLEEQAQGVARIVVGTYAANYKARALLEKKGYRLSPDSEAVLRTYYTIPEDRLKASVTYEKEGPGTEIQQRRKAKLR
jgi:GNAT superfamily N-acetyltransferase